jgi:DNA-binding transcriptional ArsR family regulator
MDSNGCIRAKADIDQIDRCKVVVSELDDTFDFLSDGLELVGNNVRLRILYLLSVERRLCVCDLSDILNMSVSAISQHLRKMKDRKLIQTKREAQTIYYSLAAMYENLLTPIFKILDKNKLLEVS